MSFPAIVATNPFHNLHHGVVYPAKVWVVVSDFDFGKELAQVLMNLVYVLLALSIVDHQLKLMKKVGKFKFLENQWNAMNNLPTDAFESVLC